MTPHFIYSHITFFSLIVDPIIEMRPQWYMQQWFIYEPDKINEFILILIAIQVVSTSFPHYNQCFDLSRKCLLDEHMGALNVYVLRA